MPARAPPFPSPPHPHPHTHCVDSFDFLKNPEHSICLQQLHSCGGRAGNNSGCRGGDHVSFNSSNLLPFSSYSSWDRSSSTTLKLGDEPPQSPLLLLLPLLFLLYSSPCHCQLHGVLCCCLRCSLLLAAALTSSVRCVLRAEPHFCHKEQKKKNGKKEERKKRRGGEGERRGEKGREGERR